MYRRQLLLFSLLLFLGSFFLFTRANTFPFFYHPDESSKVEQIQTQGWNFNHPMLMLSTAHLVAEVAGAKEDAQRVGELGRNVSAAFCAGAATLLAAALWVSAGRFAGITAGLLLLTNHQLFELSHYLKEDTSLLFGIALWFFGLSLFWKRPGLGTSALVGIGAATALSGKYLGAFALILSLFLVPYRAEAGSRLPLVASFLGAALLFVAFFNFPLLSQLGSFWGSLDREIGLATKGHRGITRPVPHAVYFTAFRDNLFFTLWVPIFWFYGAYCWVRRKELNAFEWLIALLPVAYLLTLSFFPKTNDRYFLPATALFLCVAALGLNHFVQTLRVPRSAAILLAICLVGVQLDDLRLYYRAFQKDDLADLTHWLNETLPDATIAIDRRVMLPNPRRTDFAKYQIPLKAKVVKRSVDRFDSIEELKAEGVTHIVLSETTYGRYYLTSYRPQAGNEETYQKRRNLYETIMTGNLPIWGADRPRSHVIYLHPGLQVYRLP